MAGYVAGACAIWLLVPAGCLATPERPPFWDRYLDLRDLAASNPDSARAAAEARAREDPGDLLAGWVRGRLAAPDSMAAEEALAAGRNAGARNAPAETILRDAATQVTAGTILFARNRTEEGRAAFERARRAYEKSGRAADACYAQIWKVVARRGVVADAASERDLAVADSLARKLRPGEAGAAARADVLLLRARASSRTDTEASLRSCLEAIELLVPLPAGTQLGEAHRRAGIALKTLGRIDEAETHYQAALDLARTLGRPLAESRALAGLGHMQRARGQHRRALALQAEALTLARRMGSTEDVAGRLSDMGGLRSELGDFEGARRDLEGCLEAGRQAGQSPEDLVVVMDQLAGVEAYSGRYEAARARLEEALATCRSGGLKIRMPFLLLHQTQLYLDMNEPERARPIAEEGLAIAREVGHRRAELPLLGLWADALRETGDLQGSLRASNECIALARRTEPRFLWNVVGGKAKILADLGRPADALAALDSLITLFPTIPDSMRLGRTFQLKGSILLDQGKVAEARALFDRSLAIARRLRIPARVAAVELDLGKAALAAGSPEESRGFLEHGLAWFEDVRSALPASEDRIGLQSMYYDEWVALARAEIALGHPEEGFRTLERSRAQEMRRLFGGGTPGLRGKVPPDLEGEVREIESRLDEAQGAWLREIGKPADERTPDLEALEARVDSLQDAWEIARARVERESPGYAREAGLLALASVEEVRSALLDDECLLATMGGPEASLVFKLDASGLVVREVRSAEALLARKVETLAERLREGITGEEIGRVAGPLAEMLLGDLFDGGRMPKRIYVLPDGPLHHLPFEVLPVRGKMLIEHAEVVYNHSATLLVQSRPGAAPAARSFDLDLVAFGDPEASPPPQATPAEPEPGRTRERMSLRPLPFAREEALALRALFPKAEILVGPEATEGRFVSEVPRAPLLHVAAHAFVDDRHPAFSGIVLAPSEGNDGLIQAFEILDRSLDLDLAVLSACESGSGVLRRGEGLLGLARAFRVAGARNLVVSLWRVDDRATARFMGEFYRRLRDDKPPATALREAKLAVMAGGEVVPADTGTGRGVGVRARPEAGPSVWASFILIGGPVR